MNNIIVRLRKLIVEMNIEQYSIESENIAKFSFDWVSQIYFLLGRIPIEDIQ